MKKIIIFSVLLFIQKVVFCQLTKDTFHVTFINNIGEELLKIEGDFIYDSIFVFQKKYMKKIKRLKGEMFFGRVFLYKNDQIFRKLYILSVYESRISIIDADNVLLCRINGRLVLDTNQIVFPSKGNIYDGSANYTATQNLDQQ